jgi:hypothetical protein
MSAAIRSSKQVRKVDPSTNRPDNADESVPEALVADVVRTDLQQQPAASTQTRWSRIARRAYELAQQRGFAPGAELQDWLQAEQEFDADQLQAPPAPEDQITG